VRNPARSLHRPTPPWAALVALAALAACGAGCQDQNGAGLAGSPAAAAPAASPRAAGPSAAGAPAAAAPAAAPAPPPAPRAPERAAYSLIDNRLAAHLERGGGLFVPAGSAGFAKYVRFGNQLAGERPAWQLRQHVGGVPAARLARVRAAVHVPLSAAQAARGTVRVRAYGTGTLWLGANGQRPVRGQLDGGWSTVDFTLPAGQLAAGENTLELVSGAPGVAVAWLQIGADEPLEARADLAYDAARQALAIPRYGRMSWYVLVPDRARLVAKVAPGCPARARAVPEAGEPVEGVLTGEAALDLAALAGKAVRLELAPADCARTELLGAALVVSGRAPRIPAPPPPSHVLFIVLDSLRFDRVHAFSPAARAETPVLDRLAKSSTLFLSHYVQGNESQVSHASMWTSMYLAKHEAARWQDSIPARAVTLDEIARRAGLYVAGATANGYIRTSRGYGTAWNKLVNAIEDETGFRGDEVMARGLSFVALRKTQPWFLYLGLIDTHVPLRARSPWIERYSTDYKGRFAKAYLGDEEPGGVPRSLTDRDKEHVRALYDSNVSYQDELLGKLVATLEEWGVWDTTLLVITADHGDELWEAGRVGHETGQDDTLLHVPLLVRYPPLFPAARIKHATEGIDVLPTIAAALGLPAGAEWQGTSLVPAAHGAEPYAGLASSSGYEKEHGARVGPWKLRLAGTAAPSLYHLPSDPDEQKDVFGTPAGAIGGRLVLDAMSLLRAHHAVWRKSRWGNAGNVTPRFAADLGE